jgi:hypothetical protein
VLSTTKSGVASDFWIWKAAVESLAGLKVLAPVKVWVWLR